MKIAHLLPMAAALAFSVPVSAAQITFDGGTATLCGGGTVVTSNAALTSNVDYYEEDGFRLDFVGGCESIGNYYGVGNAVIHAHWAPIGSTTEIVITKIGGGSFDLNYFILTSNTQNGGGPATGAEQTFIEAVGGPNSGYAQQLPSEDWGFPATSIFLGSQFDAVTSARFFVTNNVFCFGMDEFFIDQQAPGVPEPASVALLGIGLLALFGRRRFAK